MSNCPSRISEIVSIYKPFVVSDYISLNEASRLSGYHQDYLSQLIRSGKLRGRRFGRGWMIRRVVLAEYIAERSKSPADKTALSLPWWRRNRALATGLALMFFVGVLVLFGVSFENMRASVAAGDFDTPRANDTARVQLPANVNGAQEIVVTSYSVDGDNVEVSVQAIE